MDINTPQGRIAAKHQIWCVRKFLELRRPGYMYCHTSDTDAAVIDGFIVNPNGKIVAGVEVKSRYNIAAESFFEQMHGRWLLTLQKLNDMQFLAAMLRVPMYGMLYIVPSNLLLITKLVSEDGQIACNYYAEETETQRCINGGTAVRPNAFIDMTSAAKIELPEPDVRLDRCASPA